MSYIEIKSQLGTKEFELALYKGKYYLNILAYGDWWDEEYSELSEVEECVKETWHFTNDDYKKLLDNMETVVVPEGTNTQAL